MNSENLFDLERDGRRLTITVHGPVTSLAEETSLSKIDHLLAAIASAEVRDVVVDFQQSPYFGSCMLETLRQIWNQIHARGGRMILCNLSPVGLEIIQLAKFDQLWPVVPTREQAAARLGTR
jgi:anti-anti-sigma factor